MGGPHFPGVHATMQPGITYTGEVAEKMSGAMEVIDHGLNRLEESISHLERRIGPALTQYAEQLGAEVQAGPAAEPSSQIRGRADRLNDLVSRLESISSRVEL